MTRPFFVEDYGKWWNKSVRRQRWTKRIQGRVPSTRSEDTNGTSLFWIFTSRRKNGIGVLKEMKLLNPTTPSGQAHPLSWGAVCRLCPQSWGFGLLNERKRARGIGVSCEKILGGGVYVSPACGEQLVRTPIEDKGLAAYQVLSDRALEVLRLIGQGNSLTKVSDRLSLSVKTIETDQTRIKKKWHLDTTAALIRLAMDHPLVNGWPTKTSRSSFSAYLLRSYFSLFFRAAISPCTRSLVLWGEEQSSYLL